MACGTIIKTKPGCSSGFETNTSTDCFGACFEQISGGQFKGTLEKDESIQLNDKYADREGNDCNNGCNHACAFCADQCGAKSCITNCHGKCGGCDSLCSGCDGKCGGCASCRGTCEDHCQGTCNDLCNIGCESEAMEQASQVKLEKIINVKNIKLIFEFVKSEFERRKSEFERQKIDFTDINKLDDLFNNDENGLKNLTWDTLNNTDEVLKILYYLMPYYFENAFKSIGKEVPIQSGYLTKEGKVEHKDPNDSYKYYADRISALKWIEIASELYKELVPVWDGE